MGQPGRDALLNLTQPFSEAQSAPGHPGAPCSGARVNFPAAICSGYFFFLLPDHKLCVVSLMGRI